MNILVISSILPIPSVVSANDFIFQLYGSYRRLYPGDHVVIVKPVRYDFSILRLLKGKTVWQKLKGKRQWLIEDFQVKIFHFLSAWRYRNLHAFVTRSVFYLNRRRIDKLIHSSRFDIIHARYIFSDGIMARMISKRYGIPYVISTHDEMFYFDHSYSRKVAMRILNQAALLLPVSYSNRTYFKEHVGTKVVQFTHGFNESFIKEQRKLSNEKVRILTVCKLLKYKNVDMVINALHQLSDSHDYIYTLIGDGPESNHIHHLVSSLGLQDRVNFIEHVPHDQIADEMYNHDIFILPSYFETFGRVYFEAMAMGIPVICAKNSGIFGLFREGKEGMAVDHTNVAAIADALAFLIDHKEERLKIGKQGQELVNGFTWQNRARDLRKIYMEVVSPLQ
jgi:glycosyltransferase involved in cell wall biosynthesis